MSWNIRARCRAINGESVIVAKRTLNSFDMSKSFCCARVACNLAVQSQSSFTQKDQNDGDDRLAAISARLLWRGLLVGSLRLTNQFTQFGVEGGLWAVISFSATRFAAFFVRRDSGGTIRTRTKCGCDFSHANAWALVSK